jgi:hypothetical protein
MYVICGGSDRNIRPEGIRQLGGACQDIPI